MTPKIDRLRVLHSVGHLLRGGIERWLYEIVRTLDRERYEHHIMVWTDQDEAFTAEFRNAGVKIHVINNYKNPIQFSRGFNRLVKSDGPFDILHTHGTQFMGFIMLVAKNAGIRNRLAHSHTDIVPFLYDKGRGYRAYAAIGHRAIRTLATAGLACSNLAAISMFGENWQSDARWGTLLCGFDLTPFAEPPDHSLRAALRIPPGSFVVGHVGRFEDQKNHKFLFEVAVQLINYHQNVHFLLIGDGSLRNSFIESIKQKNLGPYFTMLQDCRTVPQHMMSAMDAFVFPSVYEGLGIVAIEAQAAGLPCLMSTAVPEEAVFIPTLAQRIPLAAGASAWAQALLCLPRRVDPSDIGLRNWFEQSAFNIKQSASSLASTYDRIARMNI
jgi:glycosyltransferase involved in cell wall biosynthesis